MLHEKIDTIQFICAIKGRAITDQRAINLAYRFTNEQLQRILSITLFKDLQRAIDCDDDIAMVA
jgi:hypothetical protein